MMVHLTSHLHSIIKKLFRGYMSSGLLRVDVISSVGNTPVRGARVRVFDINNEQSPLNELTTDENGKTEAISLTAPPLQYSEEPSATQPYTVYNIEVSANGFESFYVSGAEILPDVLAIQNVSLIPLTREQGAESFVIGPHTLYGNYPPKIEEAEVKDVSETGEIVLSRVVIPEYVVVHDGPPTDASAMNYYVRYRDYIKNVASSEIYATWEEAAILANILAIMSFTLNRVYTEW